MWGDGFQGDARLATRTGNGRAHDGLLHGGLQREQSEAAVQECHVWPLVLSDRTGEGGVVRGR